MMKIMRCSLFSSISHLILCFLSASQSLHWFHFSVWWFKKVCVDIVAIADILYLLAVMKCDIAALHLFNNV